MGDTGFDTHAHENDATTDVDSELRRTEQIAFGPCGAESGAVGAENDALDASDDLRLRWLIDAWPTLGEVTRDAIVKLAGLRSDDVEDFNDSNALPHGKGVSR